MILGSDDKRVILINARPQGDYLLCGLVYFEPSQAQTAIVTDPLKTLVYRVSLPDDIADKVVPMTAPNYKVKAEKIG